MSDSLSRIADDEEDYLRLCEMYGEKPELMQGSFGKMVNPYGPHAKCLEERRKAERDGPTILQSLPTHMTTYQPEMWNVRKDYIYMAIAALDAALEHTRETLAVHDRDVGRTTKKNLTWARVLEADIRQMEECLRVFKELP
jgi:hypothetical protein